MVVDVGVWLRLAVEGAVEEAAVGHLLREAGHEDYVAVVEQCLDAAEEVAHSEAVTDEVEAIEVLQEAEWKILSITH